MFDRSLRDQARTAVRQAIKAGIMAHPSTLPCADPDCWRDAQEYDHHLGYAPEHHLDVVPLCRPHHRRAPHDSPADDRRRWVSVPVTREQQTFIEAAATAKGLGMGPFFLRVVADSGEVPGLVVAARPAGIPGSGRRTKYASDEERLAAKREYGREYSRKISKLLAEHRAKQATRDGSAGDAGVGEDDRERADA